MAELVDALGLGPSSVNCAGSSPVTRTIKSLDFDYNVFNKLLQGDLNKLKQEFKLILTTLFLSVIVGLSDVYASDVFEVDSLPGGFSPPTRFSIPRNTIHHAVATADLAAIERFLSDPNIDPDSEVHFDGLLPYVTYSPLELAYEMYMNAMIHTTNDPNWNIDETSIANHPRGQVIIALIRKGQSNRLIYGSCI